MTNGVEFSLVVGGCCLIKFNNTFQGITTSQKSTININSTGAKYVYVCKPVWYDVHNQTPGWNSYQTDWEKPSNESYYRGLVLSNPALVVFDGTRYAAEIGTGAIGVYYDYGDG